MSRCSVRRLRPLASGAGRPKSARHVRRHVRLRFKFFTFDEKERRAINFYVWESDEAAEGFFTEELRERMSTLYRGEADCQLCGDRTDRRQFALAAHVGAVTPVCPRIRHQTGDRRPTCRLENTGFTQKSRQTACRPLLARRVRGAWPRPG
jgi:hypothetical protein